jgi:hypothetical protein
MHQFGPLQSAFPDHLLHISAEAGHIAELGEMHGWRAFPAHTIRDDGDRSVF